MVGAVRAFDGRTNARLVATAIMTASLGIGAGPATAARVSTTSNATNSRPATVSASPWTTRQVLNVAHAGGDLEAPHSTLFAMKSAVAGGADVLEMDVRMSADNVLMIQHDDTVDRTTGTTGLVSDYTAGELQAMDNAYWFVPNCWSCHGLAATSYALRGVRNGSVAPPVGFVPADFGIATLAQVRSEFPERILNIELKTGPTAFAAADALAAFIAANGPSDGYVVASFDDTLIAYFESIAPGVATSPSQNEMIDWFVSRGPMPRHQVLQVPPTFGAIDVVTQQFVDDAHANGLAVWVWFNGESDDVAAVWNQLLDFGVDGLLSGHPVAVQALLEARMLAYSVAPSVAPHLQQLRRNIAIEVTCPALHVDRCASLIVIVARDARGQWGIVGRRAWNAARTVTSPVEIRKTSFGELWIRAVRSGEISRTAFALAFPANSDTAPSVTPIAA